jgi:hypothetical protein
MELPKMRTSHPTQTSHVYRLFFISAVVVAAIVAFSERGQLFFSGSDNVVRANVEPVSPGNSMVTYRWNLDDAGLPLLSLPDHIRGGVDLSITYSMDQFQFPLFQSLYYNERVGKYILMVMPKDGRRAEFIDLLRVKGPGRFAARGNSSLRLENKGSAKLLTTGEGTMYTFGSFGNGEFHCSQIRDRDGRVIKIKYTKDASIDTIVDIFGRTISFGYEKAYVSSITQTWGSGSVKRQTWAIADEAIHTMPAPHLVPAGARSAKHIPSNAVTPSYTPAMAASDMTLATIFGGPGAIAAAHGFEPEELASQYPLYRGDLIGDDGQMLHGHLTYAMHLYGSANGTNDTELYVPSGFTSHSSTPTSTDAAVTFYYPRLGNLTDVTLAVFHIANFHLSYEGDRVRIGSTGGRGGSIACYRHAHLEFYRGNTGLPSSASRPRLRIDPTTVFETTSNIASRSKTTSTRASY